MQALTPEAVIAAFDLIDRPDVELPDLSTVAWDERDYLSWVHPEGHRAYMCVALPERVVGLVFRLTNTDRPLRSGLCDLCLTSDRECGSTMAMVDSWGEPRLSLGLHVCRNFDCSDGVRGKKWVDAMGETISTGRRIERLQENVERFVRRVTGLEKPRPQLAR